jgi:serine carboxypeptidase-like clade 2
VEAFNSPETAPVTWWSNGGPGCSGIGGGFFSEHGPYRPNNDGSGSLVAFPWTWAETSNMLYVEQPAGVGFSYSNTTEDYTVGDERAAADMYEFLQRFLGFFPQYRSNELWITSESYGGKYVPATAKAIIEHNVAGDDPRGPLNFAGFQVGNAWTDPASDNTGAVEMWYWHGFIDNATRNGILDTCNMSNVGPLALFGSRGALGRRASLTELVALAEADKAADTTGAWVGVGKLGFTARMQPNAHGELEAVRDASDNSCDFYQDQATAQLSASDIYNAYGDVCTGSTEVGKAAVFVANVTAEGGPIVDSNNAAGCSAGFYNPCVDGLTAAYLNRADVQAALHVNHNTIPGSSHAWSDCSSVLNYSRADLLRPIYDTYEYILTNWPQGRYLVYSGNVDLIVPFTGTRMWLRNLGQMVGWQEKPNYGYRAYLTPNGQLAGHSVTYVAPNKAELTFATVRNAGHLVPDVQASRGLQMFSTFLQGPFPSATPTPAAQKRAQQ